MKAQGSQRYVSKPCRSLCKMHWYCCKLSSHTAGSACSSTSIFPVSRKQVHMLELCISRVLITWEGSVALCIFSGEGRFLTQQWEKRGGNSAGVLIPPLDMELEYIHAEGMHSQKKHPYHESLTKINNICRCFHILWLLSFYFSHKFCKCLNVF